MLIALLAVLLLGGGGNTPIFSKATVSAIEEAITEEQRSNEVKSVIEEIEQSRKDQTERLKIALEQLGKQELNRAASTADLTVPLKQAAEYRREVARTYSDGIFKMREKMTAGEWKAAFGS